MNVKKICIIVGVTVLLIIGLCLGAYRFGAVNTRNNSGAERRAAEISRVHTELGDEQRANKERLDRIYQLTTGADAAIGELRQSNRRSGNLLSLLELEVNVLEDYINNIRSELAGYRRDAVDNPALEVGN